MQPAPPAVPRARLFHCNRKFLSGGGCAKAEGPPGRLWKHWGLRPETDDAGPQDWPWDVIQLLPSFTSSHQSWQELAGFTSSHQSWQELGGRLLHREASDLDRQSSHLQERKLAHSALSAPPPCLSVMFLGKGGEVLLSSPSPSEPTSLSLPGLGLSLPPESDMGACYSASPPAQGENMFGCLSSDWLQMTTLGFEHLAGVQTVRLTDETASPAPLPPPRLHAIVAGQPGLPSVRWVGTSPTSDCSDQGPDPLAHRDLITVTSQVPSGPHLVGPGVVH